MLVAAAGVNFPCECALKKSIKIRRGEDTRHTLLGDADGERPEERVEDPEGFRDVSPGCDTISKKVY